jgi:hypothetical protein
MNLNFEHPNEAESSEDEPIDEVRDEVESDVNVRVKFNRTIP